MKPNDIKPGNVYASPTGSIRKVVGESFDNGERIVSFCSLTGARADQDHGAANEKTFATWAARQVNPGAVEDEVAEYVASKVKLTPNQRQFLQDLPYNSAFPLREHKWESRASQLHILRRLMQKGIVEILPPRSGQRRFEFNLTEAGLKFLADLGLS